MTIELDGVNNTLKTDKIEPQSGTALQVGASGDTITLPSGATLNIAGTISNSGTATGFGAIDWQTSDVKTSTFTAVAGKGYFVNTTGGAITVNLPAGSAGAQVALVDYAGTWDTNNCTVSANGSDKIQGGTSGAIFSRDREALQLVYIDSTQGWVITSVADQGGTQAQYVTATGGTITTSGDFKIHTFTGDGTFTVTNAGNAQGSTTVDYLIVAGGGGGAKQTNSPQGGAGGAGAGGMRFSFPNPATGGTSVSAQGYPVSVGAGGAGGTGRAPNGQNSAWNSITSAGGGGGAGGPDGPQAVGQPGGSGGGGAYQNGAGGSGNTPPVSPPQGNNGGAGSNGGYGGGGGGGHGGAGVSLGCVPNGGTGGAGTALTITGSSVTYAGGGGGGAYGSGSGGTATGGGGAGGKGCGSPGSQRAGANGTDNTGGGGGGTGPGYGCACAGGTGGSGVVIIRYKYQN